MNSKRMLQQFHAIFGIFMVFFYMGVGIFLLFFAQMFSIAKALKIIIGTTFLIYGIYRTTVTYKQLRESFSPEPEEEEE